MFQTPEPLNPEHHRQLKLSLEPDYSFSSNQIATPVVSGEKWQIAREYILVFPSGEEGLPLALLGTQAGVNAYLREGSSPWWGRYVPAHLRRYPFVASADPEENHKPLNERSFKVMIDTSAPQLSTEHGQPLFDDNGQPSKLLQEVQRVLANLQRDMEITQSLIKELDKAGVLIDQAITISPSKGEPIALKGFRIVDQETLRALPPEQLSELLNSGALDLAYAHIASLSNVRDGLLAKKAAGEVGEQAPEVNIEELFGTDDDFSFDFDS